MTVIHGANPYGNYLIGSEAPLTFQRECDQEVSVPSAQADLNSAPDYSPVPLTSWPSVIRNLVWLTGKQVKAYAGRGPILTDNRPLSTYFLFQDFGGGMSGRPSNWILVVTGLLGLLVISIVLDTLWRPSRPAARTRVCT